MDREKIQKFAALCILAVMVWIGLQQITGPKTEGGITVVSADSIETTEDSFSQPEIPSEEIVIHIAGAVQNPGVYTLFEGQRVEDAIQKAGIAENANVDALNRAAILQDGQKIVVPYLDESNATQSEAGLEDPNRRDASFATHTTQINLNQASLTELMDLPGIGEVKAGAIIRYRQEHGGFQSIEELLMVNGIGDSIYAQIADLVCI